MLNRFILLIGALTICVSAFAQTALRIVVQNKNNNEKVPYAYIYVSSSVNNSAQPIGQTDENGVANIAPESYPCTIEIKALGFEPIKKDLYTPPASGLITFYLNKQYSSLNEVVITGLTQPAKQKDALSVYRIITKEQIQAQGAVTLNEVMKNQLNVRVENDNILGSSMRMQGLGGDKVKILIDGLPVNGREGGNINLGQINMNNVDRIEIIQGPMSVVYGTDALGGIINIITKKPTQPFNASGGVYYESLGKYNFDATVTKKLFDRHQITIGGGRNYFAGWGRISQYKTYLNDTLHYARSFLFKPNEQYIGNFSYSYTAPSGFNVLLASDYLNEKVSNKGNLESWHPQHGAYVFDEYYFTTRSNNRLSLNGKLGKKGSWQSQNGYMIYDRIRNAYIKDMVTLQQELRNAQGVQDTSKFNDIYLRGSYNNTFGKVAYTAGYDVSMQHAFSLKINTKTKEIQDYAAYANVTVPVFKEKIKLQGGLRGSVNSVYHPPLIPSANILYTPVSKVQVRASYAKGYRAPSLKEMYLSFIDLNHYVIGNENLKAENSEHAQLSISYQAYEEQNDYLQLMFTGYYNNVYDGITLAPINPSNPNSIEYTYANMSHQTNTIMTTQADGQLKNIHYQVGFSYNHTFADPGNYAAFSSKEANATIQYAWRKPKLNFNLFYKYTSRQPFLQANIDGSANYNGTQSSFHICDASVEKKFLDNKIQWILGVKNIFDFRQPTVTGRVSSGAHGGGIASFLPRSVFTSLRFNIN